MKHWTMVLIGLGFLFQMGWGQQDTLREKGPTQFGVRLGYGLEIPSTNYYRGEEFSLFEAGHRFTYGAYLNIPLDWNVDFTPFVGLDQNFWPKSLGYANDCTLDSFPTYISTADTVPGRNFRFNNIVVEPGFRFYIPRASIFLKFQAHLTYSIRARVENYPFACGLSGQQNWLDYRSTSLANHNRFNLGFGTALVKEVTVGDNTGVMFEVGTRIQLTPLLSIQDADPNGPYFSLFPWNIFINLGVFRN